MWSVQSQRVSVTVKFWGRLDGLLNCFANSTVCSLQSLVFDCRSRVVLPFLQPLCFRFRFVFSMHVYVAVRLCLSLSLPPFLCLFYALPLPLFLPFALPLSFLFFWPLYAVEMMTRAIKISGDFTCVLVHKADTHTNTHTQLLSKPGWRLSMLTQPVASFWPNLKLFAAIHNSKLKAKNNMLSVRFIQGELWIYTYTYISQTLMSS